MTPEIVSKDEFIVVGVRAVLDLAGQDIGLLWKDKFLARQTELAAVDHRFHCVFNLFSDAGGKPGRVEYVAGMVTNSLEDIPVGMVGWVVLHGVYVGLDAIGQIGISEAYQKIVSDWLPGSGYMLGHGPVFAFTDSLHPGSPETVWRMNVSIETIENMERLKKFLG